MSSRHKRNRVYYGGENGEELPLEDIARHDYLIRRKVADEEITGIMLKSSSLVIDANNTQKTVPANDYRQSNTSSDMTLRFASPIILDRDNFAYYIGLDPSTSVPHSAYNVLSSRANNTFTFTWSSDDATFAYPADGTYTITISDGDKSLEDIQTEINQYFATGQLNGDDPAEIKPFTWDDGSTNYPIVFINDTGTSKVRMIASLDSEHSCTIVNTARGNGWASGIMGLFGYVGSTDEVTVSAGVSAVWTPERTANINDDVTSYDFHCDITRGTFAWNGITDIIKTFNYSVTFGSRQDFTQQGPIRFCAVDSAISRFDSIRVWVTDNLNREIDWNKEASSFLLQFRKVKM